MKEGGERKSERQGWLGVFQECTGLLGEGGRGRTEREEWRLDNQRQVGVV